MTYSPSELFSESGLLQEHIDGFYYRPEQLEMAEFITLMLENHDVGIVEAGTGTGKTFAYLVPVLLSGYKAIISTGTKNLQDQLFFRDLPLITKALGGKHLIALLKGRANYLCLYRLNRNLKEGQFFSRETVRELQLVHDWSTYTKTGDIAELDSVSENASIWPHVTSTGDNCLGPECPFYRKCHLNAARQKAQKADILVVNHHLFMADLSLKEIGFGELFPEASAVIFDEAHQLAKVASQFFGISLSSRQLMELTSDVKREYVLAAKDTKQLKTGADRLEKHIQDVRLALGTKARRDAWSAIKHNSDLKKALKYLKDEMHALEELLSVMASRSKGLENCYRRTIELRNKLNELTGDAHEDYIHWFETFKKHFSINLTPMSIAEPFIMSMQRYECAWIFTSATMTVNHDFNYFANGLGLETPNALQLKSPFDFEKQALLYIPKELPLPNSPRYTETVVQAAIPVLKASQGRAFFLFTSFRALYEAEDLLKERLEYPLLVQGSMPKAQLLKRFREHGNAILLGTNSFWEGVDMRGEVLSCVIIDKLPFASPGDPILKARLQNMQAHGLEPFSAYQLPQAVISLKQGIGRLIRDANDRGVLMICDPRLLSRSYGRVFLNSLPKMKGTQEVTDIEEFLY